jgi:hypothetical protein
MSGFSKHLREVRKAAEMFTDDYEVEINRHIKVRLRHGNQARLVSLSQTPSDRAALENIRRDMKKAMMSMGWQP